MTRPRPVISFVLLLGALAAAQQPGVELRLDSPLLELGEAVNVQIICTNTAEPGTPEASVPPGLELTLLNPTPSQSSFTQIINGRTSRRATYTYWMRLVARAEGTYTLGPVTVSADGKTYATQPVQVTVRKTQSDASPNGDRIVFAELSVTPTSLYVTQTYTATLNFGIRKVEIDGQVFNLEMLRDVLDGNGSQLSIFADGRATRSERWIPDSKGVRHRYEIFQVVKKVRAEEVGTTQVGPVFLRANYPTGLRRGFFGGYEVTGRQRESARAEAVAVQVMGPPQDGRPADYSGAIGSFAMNVSAKPTRVEQGQPITLSVSISGSPLEGVAGPNLSRNAELVSRFDFTQDELLGDTTGEAKVFHRAIFPKQAGEQTVPPITWSYFDPTSERFVTLTSDPISIAVDPGTASTTTLVTTDNPKSQGNGTVLTLVHGGIEANFADPREVLTNQAVTLGPASYATLAACPVAWLAVTLLTRYRTRLETDPRFARRRRARRAALGQVDRAMRLREPSEQLDGLADALSGYLSDHLGLSTRNLTPAEVRALPTANGFDQPLAREIADFLESCDAVRYAPSSAADLSPTDTARRVRLWIKRMEGTRRD